MSLFSHGKLASRINTYGEIKVSEGYRVYKSGDFIRKTAEGQLDLQQSLDLVKELVTASGFHRGHDLLVDLRQT